jgi:hypothetical protein
MDDGQDAGGQPPLDDGRWVAILELLGELEDCLPGVSARVHERVVRRLALADVVRLHGLKSEPLMRKAYADAERRLGLIAVVASRRPSKRKKRRKP